MLKQKLKYFDHLMGTDKLLEKSLMLGRIKGRRRDTDLNNKCMDTKGEGGCAEGIGRLGLTYVTYVHY